ncbi:MAG TPA: response regulator [Nitrolancea sp.]|nr:response regulator [Nitrolancea sp.]
MAQVLIVDDDPAIREMLDELLRDEGYDTLRAADGRSAVEIARSSHPSLILMDLMLPVLDGAAAIRLLKNAPHTQQIRIIAMSAGANLRLHADHLPADSVLGKPFDLDALLADVAIQTQATRSSDSGSVAS